MFKSSVFPYRFVSKYPNRIVLFALVAIVILSSVSIVAVEFSTHPPINESANFPANSIEYESGKLINNSEITEVLKLEDVDLGRYPNLTCRVGFSLKRAIYALASTHYPPDVLGYVVAIFKNTSRGFVIEPMNWTQGAFIFAPIQNEAAALEYIQFMTQDVGCSSYIRDYEEIIDARASERALSEMREQNYTFLEMPPVNTSRTTSSGDLFTVERLCLKQFSRQKLIYSKYIVDKSGMAVALEVRVLVVGDGMASGIAHVGG